MGAVGGGNSQSWMKPISDSGIAMKVNQVEILEDGSYRASIENGIVKMKVPFLLNGKKETVIVPAKYNNTKRAILEWISSNGNGHSNCCPECDGDLRIITEPIKGFQCNSDSCLKIFDKHPNPFISSGKAKE